MTIKEELFKMSYGYVKTTRSKKEKKPKLDKKVKTLHEESNFNNTSFDFTSNSDSINSTAGLYTTRENLTRPDIESNDEYIYDGVNYTQSYDDFNLNSQHDVNYFQYSEQNAERINMYDNDISMPKIDVNPRTYSYTKSFVKLYFIASVFLLSTFMVVILAYALYDFSLFSFISNNISEETILDTIVIYARLSIVNVGLSATTFIFVYSIEEEINYTTRTALIVLLLNFAIFLMAVLILRKVLKKGSLFKDIKKFIV